MCYQPMASLTARSQVGRRQFFFWVVSHWFKVVNFYFSILTAANAVRIVFNVPVSHFPPPRRTPFVGFDKQQVEQTFQHGLRIRGDGICKRLGTCRKLVGQGIDLVSLARVLA